MGTDPRQGPAAGRSRAGSGTGRATPGWKSSSSTSLQPRRKHPRDVADPIFELAESMRADAGSEAFRAEARAFVQRMIADLPPDGRDFAGKDEAALELFLDRVLASGTDLVTARLKAGGSQ